MFHRAALATLLFLAPALAQAGTLVDEHSVNVGPYTELDDLLQALPKFNTALGDLIQVKIRLDSQLGASGYWKNLVTDPQSNTRTSTMDFKFNVVDDAGISTLISTQVLSNSIQIAKTLGANEQYNIDPPITDSDNKSFTYTSDADLSLFKGPGEFTFHVLTTADTHDTGNTGNIEYAQLTTGIASVTVQYLYTPAVPEPSSVVLLGVAGTMVGGAAVRRRKACA
ncbi:choice-of-anchor E domain-containing protein [Aquisphaera insulae]|uniref:choice-of-anchor E domain-containing protein n=1 Tax=Aquisphaera insulae TaxID=2712864 RepID=UPI0013EB133E|nr:PEP-CTERM sorting domain-containing protein [Aquisphaera insulae]